MFDMRNQPVISLKSLSGFWIRTSLCVHVSRRLLVPVVVHAYYFVIVLWWFLILVLENPCIEHLGYFPK